MKIEFRKFHGPSDWGWVNQQVPIIRCEDTTGIMAVDLETNETVAACIMDNWTQNSVQCHFMIATPMVLRHKFIECCCDYIFKVANVARIYALVPADNTKSEKLCLHMGFTEKARLEEAFKVGVDYLILEMKRENCRFIQQEDKAA